MPHREQQPTKGESESPRCRGLRIKATERDEQLARELADRLDAGDLQSKPDDDPELKELLQLSGRVRDMVSEPDSTFLEQLRRERQNLS